MVSPDDIPSGRDIEDVHEYIYDLDILSMLVANESGGYEVEYETASERETLQAIVNQNKVQFENPGRIEYQGNSGVVLLLPYDWERTIDS